MPEVWHFGNSPFSQSSVPDFAAMLHFCWPKGLGSNDATAGRDYLFIQDDRAFRDYHKNLRDHKVSLIAMDFEGEFNLHVYGNHLCLIQLFDGKQFAAIDPIKIAPESLKAFFEDRTILLHSRQA